MKLRTQDSRLRTSPRATVIVLVVAVLALLAIIGTVYIVSSQAERRAATSSTAAANVDNAQRAVNEVALQLAGEPLFDGNGTIAGPTPLGPVGDRMARTHDIGELNLANPGYAAYTLDGSRRDQSWLATDLYRTAYGANPNLRNMTYPQTRWSAGGNFSPSVFDPATSQYDIPIFLLDGSGNLGSVGAFNVVADPLPNTALPDAFVQMLPFSEANGVRYRFGLRILDTSRMANLNVGNVGTFNGNYAALPLWLQNGTYPNGYLLDNPAATFDGPLASMGAAADNPLHLNVTTAGFGLGNSGRFGMLNYNPIVAGLPVTPIDYISEQLMYRFESPMRSKLPVSAWDNLFIAPFDLSDELALRAYGAVGTYGQPRPAIAGAQAIWPNTLGNLLNPPSANININVRRDYYTTYSYSRDLRSAPDPSTPFTVTGLSMNPLVPSSTPGYVWPPYPAKVGINPDIAPYTRDPFPNDQLVLAATNIATAMRASLYTQEEACAFAANYLTYRWNSWTVAPTTFKGNTVNAYSLPLGPSYVDAIGICLRSDAASSFSYGPGLNELNAGAGKVYLGYAAQPFINEVAISYHYDAMASANVPEDCAIELYNPYDVALSLDDYKLIVNGSDVPLAGKGIYIPARGYFVVTQKTGKLDTTPTPIPNTAVFTDISQLTGAAMDLSSGGKIFLMRRYVDRASNQQWGAIDQYSADPIRIDTPPSSPPADGTKSIDFLVRNNRDDSGAEPYAHWAAVVHDPAIADVKHTDNGTPNSADSLSLGTRNFTYDATLGKYVALYDRVITRNDLTWERLPLDNINDFNRIMRITSQIDTTSIPSGAPAAPDGPISVQLATRLASPTPVVASTMFPLDAEVHFDFLTDSNYYSSPSLPAALPNPVLPTVKPGDLRAIRLLQYLTFSDRVSDYTIDIGDSMTADRGISKIRIPGQINVNTAPAEVLATIPVLGKNPGVIGLIMAYRWRTTTADPRIPLPVQGTAADFSGFPGYGIRSLGELQVALLPAVGASTTLADRDALWGAMIATLTVRSDTFVVYAYLEAVRQNPRYGGAFDNASIWYNNTPAGVTDDPTNATAPLLRVARRRWVAIVDRSQSNFNRLNIVPGPVYIPEQRFTLPHIVAQKDLPN